METFADVQMVDESMMETVYTSNVTTNLIDMNEATYIKILAKIEKLCPEKHPYN